MMIHEMNIWQKIKSRLTQGDRGDSLLEVIMAITVLSVVAVGSMAVVNQGNALAQAALGRSEIRAMINTQSQLLQYARVNSNLWSKIRAVTYTSNNRYSDTSDGSRSTSYTPLSASGSSAARSFWLDNNGNVDSSISQPVPYGTGRSWIDGVCLIYGNFCDFYIKASWTAAGEKSYQSVTIVRIYDDKSTQN